VLRSLSEILNDMGLCPAVERVHAAGTRGAEHEAQDARKMKQGPKTPREFNSLL
jgi:hypothetical protein